MGHRKLKGRHDGGQSVIEFAIAVPVLFAIIYGICDFGRALYTYDLVASAARIGSRYAIVHGSGCPLPTCPATSAAIATYVQSKVTGLAVSQLTVTTVWSKSASCTTAPYQGPLCIATVTVSYPFQFVLALQRTLTMNSSSQMVISQ